MPFTRFDVVEVFKDPTTVGLVSPSGQTYRVGNRNNVAVLRFVNDGDQEEQHYVIVNGDDLNDSQIARQAFFVLQSLNAQEQGLRSITVANGLAPESPDQKQIDLLNAESAFKAASLTAMVKERADPNEQAAYQAFLAAQGAATASL